MHLGRRSSNDANRCRPQAREGRRRVRVLLAAVALSTQLPATAAEATIASVLGGTVSCTVQTGGNLGERHCSGTFLTFDGAPIDVNIGFPPAPGVGADGNFPIIGVFHGWGGAKISLTNAAMQEFLDAGYAVFSMSDRGWGNSCGATDPKRLTPGVCDHGYNHLMDTRYEVRDAQEAFASLADQAADGATNGRGLIDPHLQIILKLFLKLCALGVVYCIYEPLVIIEREFRVYGNDSFFCNDNSIHCLAAGKFILHLV